MQAVVVVGGGVLTPQALDAIGDGSLIVAADSGLDHAIAAGLTPQILVGDLDSISAAGRMWAYEHTVEIEEHAPDKDLADTELAIARALATPDVRDLLLLSGAANTREARLDHLFGLVLALGHPSLAALDSVSAVIDTTELHVLHPGHSATLDVATGQQFSLLALHGTCEGVSVRGARWPLENATLSATECRGLSNEATANADVSVQSGVLTVVIP